MTTISIRRTRSTTSRAFTRAFARGREFSPPSPTRRAEQNARRIGPCSDKNENAARDWAAFWQEVQRSLAANLHQTPEISIPVAGIEPVELAQQRRPYQRRRAQFGAIGVREHAGVLVHDGRVDRIGGRSQHAGAYLHGAGPLEVEHAFESGR